MPYATSSWHMTLIREKQSFTTKVFLKSKDRLIPSFSLREKRGELELRPVHWQHSRCIPINTDYRKKNTSKSPESWKVDLTLMNKNLQESQVQSEWRCAVFILYSVVLSGTVCLLCKTHKALLFELSTCPLLSMSHTVLSHVVLFLEWSIREEIHPTWVQQLFREFRLSYTHQF